MASAPLIATCSGASGASLVTQSIKEPAMQETQVRSPGWEDPLEKGMVTHSSILAWRILWTQEPGRLQSMGSQRVGHNLATKPSPPWWCTMVDKEVKCFL